MRYCLFSVKKFRRIFPSLPPPTFARACAYAKKYGWLARLGVCLRLLHFMLPHTVYRVRREPSPSLAPLQSTVTQKLDPEKSGPRSTFSPAKNGPRSIFGLQKLDPRHKKWTGSSFCKPKVDRVQSLQTKSGPGPVFVNQNNMDLHGPVFAHQKWN